MQLLTVAALRDVWHELDLGKSVSVDLETNGKEVYDPTGRVVTASFAGVNRPSGMVRGYQIPFSHLEGQNADPDVLPTFLQMLQEAPGLIPFYVYMEAGWLYKKYGLRLHWAGDGYIVARMAQLRDAGLKELTEKYLQRRVIRYEEVCKDPGHDFATVHAQNPLGIEYTVADSVNAFHLENLLAGKYIRPQQMQASYELEVMSMAMMAEYGSEGYYVDLQRLEREIAAEEQRTKELEKDIFAFFGLGAFAINSGAQLGKAIKHKLNLSSPRRTEASSRYPQGQESWAQDAIEDLRVKVFTDGNEEAANILTQVMDWKSRFSTLNTLKKRPGDVFDNAIHPTWNTIGFDGTTRMYSQGPSLTSLPVPARRALPAPKGKRWVKFDYKQAEIRLLAFLSGDEDLIAYFNSEKDFHSRVFSEMSGKPYEQVTENDRDVSKVISYSILYSGGDEYHVAMELRISREEAREKVAQYLALFPKLRTFLNQTRANALATRHVRTYMNRLRRLEGTDKKMQDQACNAMGQQSMGTLLKIAMLKLQSFANQGDDFLKGFSQLVPVFDAAFYCIDEDVNLEAHVFHVKQIVELTLGPVKMEVDFASGPSMGELEKFHPTAEIVTAHVTL